MDLTPHTVDDAPAESRALLAGVVDDMGMLPNLVATAAASPALLAGFDGLRRAANAAKLDPVLRETAGLAAGVAIGNRYGVPFHSLRLGRLGLADSEIQRLRDGSTPTDPTIAAVAALGRELVVRRGDVTGPTLAAARAAGLSDEAVLEVLLECAFATLVGMIDGLAGHVRLDAMLTPRAWSPRT